MAADAWGVLQAKLKEFLALMPRDAVAAAKEQAFVPF